MKILEECELVKRGQSPYFKTVRNLCEFYDLSPKQLHKYRNRYLNTGGRVESLFPKKRGPNTWGKRTPKDVERNVVSAYRRLGLNRYELVDLFEPVYKHKTPAASTMYLIIKRYQRGLRKKEKEVIKRYEKKYPGELGHMDSYYLPKSTLRALKIKKGFLCGLVDDCTRLTYIEVLFDLRCGTVAGFLGRALSFFFRNYGIRYENILTDNGSEFNGKEIRFLLSQLKIKHIKTKPYNPQSNGKVEALWKIVNREFLYPNTYVNTKELIFNLGEYLYQFNHNRRHGGLNYITPWNKYLRVSKIITEILD